MANSGNDLHHQWMQISESKEDNNADNFDKKLEGGQFPKYMLDLLYWKDSYLSATVLFVCITIWVLLVILHRTVLSIASYMIVFILIVCLIYMNLLHVYTEYVAKSSIPKEFKMPSPSFDCMDDEMAKCLITNLRLFINSSYYHISYTLTCQSNKHTVSVICFAILSGLIGECFCGQTIFIIVIIALFIIPYIYKNHSADIRKFSHPILGIIYFMLQKFRALLLRILQSNETIRVHKKTE